MELNIKIEVKISFPMLEEMFTDDNSDKHFFGEGASLDDKRKESVRANMKNISKYLTPKIQACFMEGVEACLSGDFHNPHGTGNSTHKKYWTKGFQAAKTDIDELKLALSRKTNRLINDITNLYKD